LRSIAVPPHDAVPGDFTLALIGWLGDPSLRADAARRVAAAFGARELVVFVRDAETNEIATGAGFLEVDIQRDPWRALLSRCKAERYVTGQLRLQHHPFEPATACTAEDGSIAVLLGAVIPSDALTPLRLLLPLLAAALRGERAQVSLERALAQEAEARTTAEEANRAKALFLATMSHELRTPLNAIGGYAQLLEMGIQGPVTERQRDAIERIQNSQRKLLILINDILRFAKLEAGGVEFRMTSVQLADALCEIAPLVEPQILEKRISFTCNATPHVIIRTDLDKLRQILLNLVTNAIKFTPAGGCIELSGLLVKNEVVIRVTDNGIGIPPDRLESIFDAFVQVDTGSTREAEGVGLGLAISREFAAGLGGTLHANSEPGKGATFTLRLPLSSGNAD
jgi:signal transduction histidine kinase